MLTGRDLAFTDPFVMYIVDVNKPAGGVDAPPPPPPQEEEEEEPEMIELPPAYTNIQQQHAGSSGEGSSGGAAGASGSGSGSGGGSGAGYYGLPEKRGLH